MTPEIEATLIVLAAHAVTPLDAFPNTEKAKSCHLRDVFCKAIDTLLGSTPEVAILRPLARIFSIILGLGEDAGQDSEMTRSASVKVVICRIESRLYFAAEPLVDRLILLTLARTSALELASPGDHFPYLGVNVVVSRLEIAWHVISGVTV